MEPGPISYTLVRDGWVAYQITGDGPRDIVYVPGFIGAIDAFWDSPPIAQFFTHVATHGRFVMLDRRGTGLSDRLPPGTSIIEEWAHDAIGVMDAISSERATLVAFDTGTPMALFTAATFPDRIEGLVLTQPYAMAPSLLLPEDVRARLVDDMITVYESTWGDGTTLMSVNPELPPEYRTTFVGKAMGKVERASLSRGEIRENFTAVSSVDVRHALPSVRARAIIFHMLRERTIAKRLVREVAEAIDDVTLVELDSANLHEYLLAPDIVYPALERFFREQPGGPPDSDRVLATVLFSDIVASTQRAASEGDRRWRATLDTHDQIVATAVGSNFGTVVKNTGDGVLAVFDGPARAIRATMQIRDALTALGIEVRQGLHTGEIERRSDDVAGLAVNIAARVGDIAESGQILVTRTVKDLVVGSGLAFEEHGEYELKGVPERWALYAVSDGG